MLPLSTPRGQRRREQSARVRHERGRPITLAGVALAAGTAVAWGRCVEAEGAPAFWPWRQVLRSLGVEPDTVLAGGVESPEDRFRVFGEVAERLLSEDVCNRVDDDCGPAVLPQRSAALIAQKEWLDQRRNTG